MVNEEKVRMMTKLAIYETGKGKESLSVNEYYKSDYICLGMIRSFFAGTIAYGILLLLWICAGLDKMLNKVVSLELNYVIAVVGISYLVFMFFYMLISYLVILSNYRKAEKSFKAYEKALKRLESMYE